MNVWKYASKYLSGPLYKYCNCHLRVVMLVNQQFKEGQIITLNIQPKNKVHMPRSNQRKNYKIRKSYRNLKTKNLKKINNNKPKKNTCNFIMTQTLH